MILRCNNESDIDYIAMGIVDNGQRQIDVGFLLAVIAPFSPATVALDVLRDEVAQLALHACMFESIDALLMPVVLVWCVRLLRGNIAPGL
jgi:hypothetical protein